ncbi:hypothetical protein [Reyranella sp.]|uniref:hypothetical protein n=1 Tax=Reyranella sp. TaxID=1929291 RepID=UPI003C7EBA27
MDVELVRLEEAVSDASARYERLRHFHDGAVVQAAKSLLETAEHALKDYQLTKKSAR